MHDDTTGGIQRVMGIDVGDRRCHYYVLDQETGETLGQGSFRTRPEILEEHLKGDLRLLVAIEAGSHSQWMSRLVTELGHQVLVANPRKLRAITHDVRKHDQLDAEMLARLARADRRLLSPLEHRTERQQADLAVIRSRDALVRTRTALINSVRGMVKPFGLRLPACSTASFANQVASAIPDQLLPAVRPVLRLIQQVSEEIRSLDREVDNLAEARYPETSLLTSVTGVGTLSALTFMLTLSDPWRFRRSRSVGSYLGLVPRLDSSGEQNPQLRITRAGDPLLRKLLVNCAHHVLRDRSPDSDLKRFGLAIAARGGKAAKKKAVIAVSRKLAILLHHLWKMGETWKPLAELSETNLTA